MKPQLVDVHVNNFLTIKARELKFVVCYPLEKSEPLTNFQHNWTTKSQVSDFSDFICGVSLPIVGGGDRQTDRHKDRHKDRHINTMARPGVGAGQSENSSYGRH